MYEIIIEYRTGFHSHAGYASEYYGQNEVKVKAKDWKMTNTYLQIIEEDGATTYYPLTSIIRWKVK